ncbi:MULTISPECIES: methyl-accepting chemotaxis protein [Burkholderia]|uniref:Methyl-accepting chemotaxis protein n=1 Tax=Burkholderia gladioli TaxID=28095 RepID=A0A2A7SEF3_BURGA|nr:MULTISPECIES: methyl-accepting chemotaxis protein [Burkholderia]MBJ9664580.1 MCP four helix bundle domain-containing protein [Burkholderia gladioli]MBU9167347.1 MCP four helix bundle domain-containing protein [Burkholderia gladioli]MBU9195264.1 MCP four helix bundle domain-containing protein [Burkholderia gladioli]MBU9214123.1 MCP four helix bundle domain-containing protein [Burkholderia gladioli]MBU9380744.1 MCP four helix bundle domain-containing protein [Burkholderia gladioli]
MNINKWSVKTKLTVAFGFLAAMVVIVSGFSLSGIVESHERFSSYVEGVNARGNAAQAVRRAVDDRAMAVRNLVLVTAPADIEIEKAAVFDAQRRVEQTLGAFNALVASATDMSERGRQLAAELPRIEAQYRPVSLDIAQLAVSGQRDAAIAAIASKCRPLLSALIKAENDYGGFVREQEGQRVQASSAQFHQQRNLLVGICLATVLLAVLAGVVITRGILRALGADPTELSEVTMRVAEGDLRPVPGAERAMAGSVLASMGAMQRSLVGLIGQVRSAADSIATGSSQIASGNVDLSSRTEQQAASLQETAASMEELTSAVRQNAENAQQASSLSANASEVAGRGNRVVSQVVGTMDEISASSGKIADITGIIEGIAFQTNILALNAAVEAARAGEQGRGFAVVASEVRSLAQRSSAAAKEIKELISSSVQKVLDGSQLVGEAGKTMTEVTQAVARVTDIMGEIAAASSEQSRGIEQVNLAVTQMDEVTQQNAALVEEAAAASKSLEDQGRQLSHAISLFRIDAAVFGH